MITNSHGDQVTFGSCQCQTWIVRLLMTDY